MPKYIPKLLAIGLSTATVVSIGYHAYYYVQVYKELQKTSQNLFTTTEGFEKITQNIQQEVFRMKIANTNLANSLNAEKNKNEFFAEQISGIQGTVNVLEKLSKTDEELLQKYSKVYFLNENYVPENLSVIDKKYTYNQNEIYQIHAKAQPFLYALLETASSSGSGLEIISAYRSFGTQASLKYGYSVVYGSGANQFSADQGYSEHQLGTTIDFTTPQTGASFSKFESTSVYKLLRDNAHKYGFVLSYPKNNQYYIYEPWHWRFVGVSLATRLYNDHQHFYDLNQREIDTYLVSIFD